MRLIRRYGRLGWFLEEIGGPQNVAIGPGQLAKIRAAFSEAGIPSESIISAILSMIHKTDTDEANERRV